MVMSSLIPTDKKKYPKYTGRNSLSANENSTHSVNLSSPENLNKNRDNKESKIGIRR